MGSVRSINAISPLDGCDDLDILVGRRLRALRLERGLTRRSLGTASGVDAVKISRFEAGLERASAARLMRLAAALGVHISAFFESDRAEHSAGVALRV